MSKKEKIEETIKECEKNECDENCECNCVENCECNCAEKDKKIQELEDALLRSHSELINYRKRKDDEVTRLLKYANEDLFKSMLPIIDNFERAILLDDNDLTDELSKFLVGFKMIYGSLENLLIENEVKQICDINKPFNPNYHQAVLTEVTDGEKGIILDVMQKGYMYKDKVIRPAMVKVSE